ncbi:type I-E CRISPR-associated endoribonuclease Cas2e [Lactiplantibacillus modestisalitolerans]|uniref:Type I-E CRISPR-associated endoribonuclease Cas2e n=1 Tax=Lactiplantibacillus modestisalitolerans TaxID=1457219 RepID=A0ABV5WRG7_9LACO|nr:type I-E CRISPR-associated endoribonuclease Cas2e [Lactiplantibacillus modestisalitolerans]
MIVITLTKVPPALRGDLTKWCQEIQTGVYVGHLNARIRDYLWERIITSIGRGEATMVYSAKGELGYEFRTTRRDYQVTDYDGIPLMTHLKVAPGTPQPGFSNAAKFRRAKIMANRNLNKQVPPTESPVVTLDLETTGLNLLKDQIIAIGAVKRTLTGEIATFERFIKPARVVPQSITDLTGITTEQLRERGLDLKVALEQLQTFVGDYPIVGYHFGFDENFLRQACQQNGLASLTNKMVDLQPIVQRVELFLDNYRLATVLKKYGIKNQRPHNALADAQATWQLADHLIKNGDFRI